jgi:integrase/recombinase XerD
MNALGKILKRLRPEIPPQTVTVYTRHNKACSQVENIGWKRCQCPKSLYVFQDGKDHRLSAGTRSWERAERLKREVEDALDPVQIELRKLREVQESKRVRTGDAIDSYLADAKKRNLAPQTLARLRTIFRSKMPEWIEQHGLHYLDDWTTNQLTEWRASWSSLGPLATRVTQERVRTFFKFCQRQEWIEKNPASLLSPVIVKQVPTDYFTAEEFEKLLQATHLFGSVWPNSKMTVWSEQRLRVIVLLMRWSGLRIGDAVTLERSRLVGNKILLYQAKTGTPVYVVLPPNVAELLRAVPSGNKPNPRYFFWNGHSRTCAVQTLGHAFRLLFKLAKIRNPDGTLKQSRPHMLRDTFAVENLLAGVPIDQVSILLGHSSVKITEKHYAPWVLARQQQLEKSVLKSLIAQGMIGGGSSGSPAPATATLS